METNLYMAILFLSLSLSHCIILQYFQMDRVIFCLFMPKDVSIYEEQMQVFFPIDDAAFTGNYNSIIKESAYRIKKIYMTYIYFINTAYIYYIKVTH